MEALRTEVDALRRLLQQKSPEKVLPPKGEKAQQPATPSANTARVTVTLPAAARMWIDNVECPLTSSVRSFDTPALNPNQRYVYNVKVEVTREGRPVNETQRVIINPGQETRVDFNNSAVVGTAAR